MFEIKKIVFISNIPSPYQIQWAIKLKERYDIQFWFLSEIENSATQRPSYWNVEMPDYCRVLKTYLKWKEFCYCPTMSDELHAYNPDLLVVDSWYHLSVFQAYRWAKRNDKPVITFPWEFSSNLFNWMVIVRNKIIYRWLYKDMDLWIANGYIHYDYFKMVLGIQNVSIFTNFDNYAPYLEHAVRKKTNVVTFLYAGAIDRRMRVPELIYVFEKLMLKHKNIKLIIGGYGPEKQICEDLVASFPSMSNSIEFHNVKSWDEIPEVYNRAHVLINFASFSPGAGVIFSAISSGMGLIATTTIHAARIHVINDYNGFLVDDEHDLFNAMERYVVEKELIEKHSTLNKRIGLDCFTFDQHLDDFSRLIKRLGVSQAP